MRRVLTILISLSMVFCVPFFSFADDQNNTSVVIVDSTEEIAEIAGAADTEAYIDIDLEDGPADLATDELTEGAREILDGSESSSEKMDKLTELLEDSGMYSVETEYGQSLEVKSIYANQRLRLNAAYNEDIETYGADKAVYYDNHYILTYGSESATREAYDALVSEYGSDSVIIDIPIRLSAYGWGTEYMGMDTEQVLAQPGADVTVAVLDSGINRNHEIFSGHTILQGYDYVNGDTDPADDNSHGTAVAGVVAESTGSNVSILPVKVLDSSGSGSALDVIYGMQYAVEQGADVINLSLGGNLADENTFLLLEEYFTDTYLGTDVVVVCASGNDSQDMDAEDVYEFPAEVSSAICVGAITKNQTACSFSNYGSAVDFAAPGQSIKLAKYSSDNGYTTISGTSFASPYVAAAAALVKSEYPDEGSDSIKEKLTEISVDLGAEGRDDYFGNGCPVFTAEAEEPEEPAGNEDQDEPNTSADPEESVNPKTATDTEDPVTSETPNDTDDADDEDTAEVPDTTADPENPDSNENPEDTSDDTVIDIGQTDIAITGIEDKIYTGSAITQAISVSIGDTALIEGTDYTVSYKSNTDAGTAVLIISGKGNYSGTVTRSFTIEPKEISPSVTLSNTAYTYNGNIKNPFVTVKYGSRTIDSSYYAVTYPSGRINAGTYTVTATLKGNYTGSGRATFAIYKADSRLAVSGKTVKIKYKNLKAKSKKISRGKAMKVSGKAGETTYMITGINKSNYIKYFKINESTGAIMVKKKIKKGTYKLTVAVTSAGNSNYYGSTKKAVVKIKVK